MDRRNQFAGICGYCSGITLMATETLFSPCRKWRYTLWREWIGGSGYAMFVGLNPSTADEVSDDPTVRRCISYAKAWGYAGLCMTNIFAFRATDPKDMKAVHDPVGMDNDMHLLRVSRHAGVVIAAWGAHGAYRGRGAEVMAMIPGMKCLSKTKGGYPAHPLYLKSSLLPIEFN